MAKSKRRGDSSVADKTPSGSQRPHSNGNHEPAFDRDRVAQRAYELYLARGGSHGSDWEDWLAAERELMTTRSGGKRRGDEGKR